MWNYGGWVGGSEPFRALKTYLKKVVDLREIYYGRHIIYGRYITAYALWLVHYGSYIRAIHRLRHSLLNKLDLTTRLTPEDKNWTGLNYTI